MAVSFSSSMATLFSNQTRLLFSNPFAVTIYSGVIPETTAVVANWATTYNQNATATLWHGTGATLTQWTDVILNVTAFPAAAVPFRNGTATWFIAWTSNVSSVNVNTIPNTKFMIGDVSGLFGNGVMKLSNVNLTTAAAITFSEMNFKYTFTG